jgi:hypothetical protein
MKPLRIAYFPAGGEDACPGNQCHWGDFRIVGDTMKFETLRTTLEGCGWRPDDDYVVAPTGAVWVGAAILASFPFCDFYGCMARRAEQALRDGHFATAEDFLTLLRALSADPRAHRMLTQHEARRMVFEPWAKRHGLTLRLWEFSRPSIRATSRHPGGGVACVEWIHEEPEPPRLFLYHWIDDRERLLRSSWQVQCWAGQTENGELLPQLEEAVRYLLVEWRRETYTKSPLGSGARSATNDEYMMSLDILR